MYTKLFLWWSFSIDTPGTGGLKDLEQQIGSNRIPLKCSYMAGEPDKLATNNESPYLLRPEIDTGQLYRLII